MGSTFATNLLPTATGLDLGSSGQQWDAFIQNLTVSGSFNGNLRVANGIRYADQFAGANVTAQINAAIADLGGSNGVVVIPSTMGTGTPTSVPSGVVLFDFRGVTDMPLNTINYSYNDGNVNSMVKEHQTVSSTANNGSAVCRWILTSLKNGTPGTLSAIDGASTEALIEGTLTGTLSNASGIESPVSVRSTGGTVSLADGVQGYVETTLGSTTVVTEARGVDGIGVSSAAGATPSRAFGLYGRSQFGKGSSRAYAAGLEGQSLILYDASYGIGSFDFEDSGHTPHRILWTNGTSAILQAMDTGGILFASNDGIVRAHIDSAAIYPDVTGAMDLGTSSKNFGNLKMSGSATIGGNAILTGLVTKYNNVNTVSAGIPAEVATVDLTNQGAAIGSTTLFTPSVSGQYRLVWNAKVTTVDAVSSTLGALQVSYTDPDGVAVTLTCPATIAAGTIATTSTGNTTGTVLVGLPLTLNCKASVNIVYNMAYVSNTAGQMKYNLHMKLEALG